MENSFGRKICSGENVEECSRSVVIDEFCKTINTIGCVRLKTPMTPWQKIM